MKTLSILIAGVLILGGCTTQRDYDFLVAHAIESLKAHADIQTVVLSPALPKQARTAASAYFKTIDQSSVVPVAGYDLAPGLFVLKSVEITGDVAHVIGTIGPIRSNANLDCGSTNDMSYRKTDTGWQANVVETIVC